MEEMGRRREYTEGKLNSLRGELSESKKICEERACVYATGSFGRSEANEYSDLDLFIVGYPLYTEAANGYSDQPKQQERKLNNLDEIIVKSELIKATKELNLPDFDGDGEYLRHYTCKELVQYLGSPDDDNKNTFTARLLLLLESKPVIGENVYDNIVKDVIKAYWRDYKDHKDEFVPTYFVNDVLRLWRTFCVNYEARTRTDPEKDKLKRRVKNYKLKHNRMLTCFSAVLYLLHIHKNAGTVHPQDLREMVKRPPIERLDWVRRESQPSSSIQNQIQDLLQAYESFLEKSKNGTDGLIEKFNCNEIYKEYINEAIEFGDKMALSLSESGGNSKLYRHLIV